MDKINYIAEIGWNFMGDMDLASRMITDAKSADATIVKFQYWNPSKLAPGPWDVDGRRQIYEKAFLTKEKIAFLIECCDKNDIAFLTSVFNVEDAQLIKSFGMTSIKIPSHATHDTKLHEFAAQNFEKVYVSLGACSTSELDRAIKIYNSQSSDNWVGMHCVSSYPCAAANANLPRMIRLKSRVKNVGYSDHTVDLTTPAVAVAGGAVVIEKHFTSDKKLPGRDNQFAVTADEFKSMVANCQLAYESMIDHGDESLPCEADTIHVYRGRWG